MERVSATQWSYLYTPDADKVNPFATINHPLIVDGEVVSPIPERVKSFYPWIKRVAKLEGATFAASRDEPVYNLWVTGDGTYRVNGYGTHCIAGTGGLLRKLYDMGDLTYEQVIDALEFVARVPKDRRLGARRLNALLENVPMSPGVRRRMAARIIASTRQEEGVGGRIYRWISTTLGWIELSSDAVRSVLDWRAAARRLAARDAGEQGRAEANPALPEPARSSGVEAQGMPSAS